MPSQNPAPMAPISHAANPSMPPRTHRQATAGHLSASIAHELNQPLGAILNNAEAAALMIKSPSPNLEEIKTIIDDIKRDDERASQGHQALAASPHARCFRPQEVDVNESGPRRVANCVGAGGRSQRNTGQKARPTAIAGERRQGPTPAGYLKSDRQWDRCYCGDAKRRARDHLQVVGRQTDRSLVSIRDTGPGIPSDRMERLFEPFFTTKQDGMAWVSALRMRSLKRTAARSRQKPVPAVQCFTSACPWPRHGEGNFRVACRSHRRRRCFFPDRDRPPLTCLRLCGRNLCIGRTAAETLAKCWRIRLPAS